MKKINIINAQEIYNDATTLVDHVASLADDDKKWFCKVYFREVMRSKHYSLIEAENNAQYVRSSKLIDSARYIVDWLAVLQERDPQMHGKLARITFRQALKHSENWHRELAKKAEKSDRYIEPDAENTPKVLDLGDGWEVFWLKTDTARDTEGEVMGHCIGSGAYDNLDESEAVFSIRKNNVTHITLHMYKLRVEEASTKGNGKVPDRYQHLVDKTAENLGERLIDIKRIRNEAGERHCLNGPAIYSEFGASKWYQHDELHRTDGPAIVGVNGMQVWCKEGQVHRLDGPAIIAANGSQEWYQDGKCHRLDGPAVIEKNGTQMWYQDGKQHRENGPAVIYPDGTQLWYKNGKQHREDGPAVIYPDGTQLWWLNGKLHRDDGPSTIYKDGLQVWSINGKRHREDGPAVIDANGTQEWWVDDKKHREDGPAVIQADGTQGWYKDGLLHREDGPAIIKPDGFQSWYKNGKLHRLDGPAIIEKSGLQIWYQNGKTHREDGPAVIDANGSQEWWGDGKQYTEEEFNDIINAQQKNHL